ncbi:MAG: beta-ketoacyl-ACP synthase 3 [Candidatus Wallbacteria bacterium]|nr:beta-ketoacyl-ACP synthase 3 [Candidatus Wallbacteria bacterium]
MNKIIGIGSYLPLKTLNNEELEQTVDLSGYDEKKGGPYGKWVERVMGFKNRHIASDIEATSDLALEASRKALQEAGIQPEDLDLIIVTTATPDKKGPNTASILQSKLNAGNNSWAFDVNAACPGFVYALFVADSLMKSDPSFKHVLVAAAEKMSTIVDRSDYITGATFSDGAGAVVLERSESEESGILGCYARSDGEKGELLDVPAGGSSMPITPENCKDIYKNKMHCLKMHSHVVKEFAVEKLMESTNAVLRKHCLGYADISYFLPHQAGKSIINKSSEAMGLSEDKVLTNYSTVGNASMASIPILMDGNKSLFKKGDNLLLAAMGGGLGWGAVLYRW